jgi:hypothetical protein
VKTVHRFGGELMESIIFNMGFADTLNCMEVGEEPAKRTRQNRMQYVSRKPPYKAVFCCLGCVGSGGLTNPYYLIQYT